MVHVTQKPTLLLTFVSDRFAALDEVTKQSDCPLDCDESV